MSECGSGCVVMSRILIINVAPHDTAAHAPLIHKHCFHCFTLQCSTLHWNQSWEGWFVPWLKTKHLKGFKLKVVSAKWREVTHLITNPTFFPRYFSSVIFPALFLHRYFWRTTCLHTIILARWNLLSHSNAFWVLIIRMILWLLYKIRCCPSQPLSSLQNNLFTELLFLQMIIM